MVSAVLFDFDLTLADSTEGAVDCLNFALQSIGRPYRDWDDCCATIGLSLDASYRTLTGRADAYEVSSAREDSLDRLLEYPAQRQAIGDVSGKSILDLGCGSGRKALDFINAGADKVVGIDISSRIVDAWRSRDQPKNLYFYKGDISDLDAVAAIAGEKFDIVTCFQAIGYSRNLDKTMLSIRGHTKDGGRFVLSTAHPFRFAIEKHDREGVPYGLAYRDESQYSYASTWNESITVSHSTPMISTCINSLLKNGFSLDAMYEPDLTKAQKSQYPMKAEWLAKYVGTIVYELTAVRTRNATEQICEAEPPFGSC